MSDRNNSTHGTSAAETFTKYGTGSNGKFLCNKILSDASEFMDVNLALELK